MRPAGRDLRVGPLIRPFDPSALNEVMRTARQAPIPDRGIKTDGDAVEGKLPVGGAKGCLLPPRADIANVVCKVRKGPIADTSPSRNFRRSMVC